MKQSANRIENEMENWLAKEQRFGKLFSAAVIKSRDFQKEKLAYLEGVRNKYVDQLSPDERLSMRVLKREQKRIEKQLYPNLFVRLLRRGFKASVKLVRNTMNNQLQTANQRYLQNQLSSMGMGDMGSRLREQMSQGKDNFSLPVSWYRNEKERMDFDLSFARQPNGTYKIENFKVGLQDQQNGLSRQHSFNITDKELTAAQATNLLAGRAVQVNEKWMQLDLNDKDTEGKFRVKEFHPGYGYDLSKAVQQLPIKELKNESSRQQLFDGLANGERQNVTIRVNGKDNILSIEANPQFKTINIFNDKNEKISVSAALGKEIQKQQKVAQTIQIGKRNGLSIG
jgi:hypothetical protein